MGAEAKKKVSILWECNCWDGPLYGLAHDGESFVWFGNRVDYKKKWKFTIYPLTVQDLQQELEIHAEFMRLVGSHTTYGVYNGRNKLNSNFKKFFKKYPSEKSYAIHMEYEKRKPLGTFIYP